MEAELISLLRHRIPPHPAVELGLGDDAAVVRTRSDRIVMTVDMLMDGVDFHLSAVEPWRVGRKALAVNLSDLAAMAAAPLAGVVALALPRQGGMDLAIGLYDGILPLADRYGLAVSGGDTNSWDGPLALSITLLGEPTARGPLRRDGARPGDRIVVSGAFGGSILGRHLDFEPRVSEALRLVERYELHAGIDVSDGLSLDLARLAEESRCGVLVDLASVPISPDAERLAAQVTDGPTALDHALSDGEDFELILAVPPAEAERMIAEQPLDIPLSIIGTAIEPAGLWREDRSGARIALIPRGYQHGFR